MLAFLDRGAGLTAPSFSILLLALVAAAAADPAIVQRMTGFGFTTIGSRPADFATVVHQNLTNWARLVTELGLRFD